MSISLRRLGIVAALAAGVVFAAVAVSEDGGASSGPATGPAAASGSTGPRELSTQITGNDAALRRAIDAWRASEDPPATAPPPEVMDRARWLQGTVRFLARRSKLAKATLRRLPGGLARQVRELTAAARKLIRLSRGARPRKLRVGEPQSLAQLLGHYRKAKRRHGIGPHYLAAINLVETKFGRVKSKSVAGARGPMQFIPSTWRIYGRGGDIHDPHDAILAAARLLRRNGAPRSYARALYAYNPSKLYVGAVQRYAKLIARDRYAVYFLYCWGP